MWPADRVGSCAGTPGDGGGGGGGAGPQTDRPETLSAIRENNAIT